LGLGDALVLTLHFGFFAALHWGWVFGVPRELALGGLGLDGGLGLGEGLGLGDGLGLGEGLGLGDGLGLGEGLGLGGLGLGGGPVDPAVICTLTVSGERGTLANTAVESRMTKVATARARTSENELIRRPRPTGVKEKGRAVRRLRGPAGCRSLDRSRTRIGSSLPGSSGFVLIWPVRIRSQMDSSLLPVRNAASDGKIQAGTRGEDPSLGSRWTSPCSRGSCTKLSSCMRVRLRP
jgi:hypothetical protein